MLTINDPNKAGQNPFTLKPTLKMFWAMFEDSKNTAAFNTRLNRPSVRTMRPQDRNFSSGSNVAFSKARIAAMTA